MKLLALAAAVFSLAAIAVGFATGDRMVALLAAASIACAITTFLSSRISSFLKIFVAIFTTELIVFGTAYLVERLHWWPPQFAEYQLPESLALTVAMFSILVYAVSFIPLVRSMTRIADRYFDTSDTTVARVWPFPAFRGLERRVATAMVVFLVLINQAEVGMLVRLNFFSRDWFNAIQTKNEKVFWYQLISVFLVWAFLYIFSVVSEFVVQSTLVIRWRSWLTTHYVDRWLDNHTHYRMSLIGYAADNPDQRISEDIYRFIDGGQIGYGIYSFTILLISKLTSLVSFAIILWDLSANFTLPYTKIALPGFLFWVALLYAGFGTIITHWIGRPLVNLSFQRQRFEADFRFSLARLREYGEQVALLRGEPTEKIALGKRFASIIKNYFEIIACRKPLLAFTSSFAQLSQVIPYVVSAPFYFAGKIELGIMTQTANAFGNVNDALTFFVTYYVSLADFKAVLDRLTSFDQAIEKAQALAFEANLGKASGGEDLSLGDVTARLPNGHEIVKQVNLQIAAEEPVLLTGPSGSGKSTLFRVVSGIWPFGQGVVQVPKGALVMLLPQKPYIPIGTLRAALTYPEPPDRFDDARLRDALEAAQLGTLISELDVDDIWSQRLSGGEQQRLAIARALLAKPDWLFLDEATTAMDEAMEARIYQAIAEKLPGTTVVSIGHRGTLQQFHKRRLEMHPLGAGTYTPLEPKAQAAE